MSPQEIEEFGRAESEYSDARWRSFRLGQSVSQEISLAPSGSLWVAIQQAEDAQFEAKARLDRMSARFSVPA